MRKTEILTDAAIRNAKPDKGKFVKRLLDGDGLYLQVTRSPEGFNRNWIFRYELDGTRHDLGLGPLHRVSLAEARRRKTDLRSDIYAGIDPAQERADLKLARLAKKAELLKATTFRECALQYYKKHHTDWKNKTHRNQWLSSIEKYAFPVLGGLNVSDIETRHIEKALEPLWTRIPATASRVQKRIEHVMNYAIAGKLTKNGDNPARYELIKARLGKLQRRDGHHPALPFVEVPAFMAKLRNKSSLSARALEFTILTCARTGETIGAKWDEFDEKKKIWTVPAERMKGSKEHRVPLSDRAVEILKALPRRAGAHVFPFSNMAMLRMVWRMAPGHTVHGFRSSFRDWAAERTNYPEFIYEMALAHVVGNQVEKAYKRTDLFERRVRLMKQWGDFVAKPPANTGKVHDLDAERERRANA